MSGLDLRGAVAVVTGASSGIGWATADALARRGAKVVVAARREERLVELAGAIERRGGTALPVPCDVSRPDQVEALRDRVLATFGRCDVLVNNAGIPGGGAFADLSMAQVERVIAVNYVAVLACTHAFLAPMLRGGRGHIVNVASLAGRFAVPGSSVYSSTKHAVVAFSESLHYEVEPRGVRVTSVNPGFVSTEGFPHRRGGGGILPVLPPRRVAEVIVRVVERGTAPEVSVPRWPAALQLVRLLAPPLYRFGFQRAHARGLVPTTRGVGASTFEDEGDS
ncbi:hypothetical protein BH20ACT24_BH20ACT24_18090 [soil metagenome]